MKNKVYLLWEYVNGRFVDEPGYVESVWAGVRSKAGRMLYDTLYQQHLPATVDIVEKVILPLCKRSNISPYHPLDREFVIEVTITPVMYRDVIIDREYEPVERPQVSFLQRLWNALKGESTGGF